ncbi:cytochrome P450 [Asanoa ishikariensis]|uniref:Cytochrome P450 n=1 Tax=Asanoa ishikariensis TaxID=137265 RepID=A0A1H3TA21_9ACTN|nr:cytochrome P450 [Asanoa ishikariensis]GIF62800.1 cytochrome P450 [Asanoa ishikariensis]SDZ47074.1 Cytochrome P450 [Asanoa ishikariensis]
MELTAPPDETLVDLADIDLYGARGFTVRDLHPTWRTLRVNAPVWWHDRPGETGFWCVTKHADCERVVKDHRTFSSEEGTILASVGVGDSAGGQTITLTDPPEHALIRVPAMRTLGHAMVQRRAPAIRERLVELLRPCAAGEVDFAHLMRRLPMVLAGEFMDIPERHWDDIALWAGACVAPEDPAYALGNSPAQTLRLAHHHLFAVFRELVRQRRAKPGDDLVSVLIGVTDGLTGEGKPLDDWRVLLNCYSFILGANTTTPNVASHTLLALTERPGLWAQLDERALPGLVEEGIRWTSPTHHLVRRATVDTRIGAAEIKAGDWIAAWVASANRDEDVFDDPFTFDIRRSPNKHLGFGGGPHYCIGAPMSRLVLTMLFEELLRRYAVIELTGPLVHLHSNWINGLVSMPVKAIPR